MASTVYDFHAKTNLGKDFSFETLKDRPILVVNTASKCGFTPQYEGLEELYREYGPKGLEIVAFPCDQFAHQEPGDDAAIEQFCKVNYGVTFPIMSKIEVNGPGAHPLYIWLKKQAPGVLGNGIKWNFTKFLVSKDGKTVTRFAPTVEPKDMRKDIERVL
jgi:glutathione peroxidase